MRIRMQQLAIGTIFCGSCLALAAAEGQVGPEEGLRRLKEGNERFALGHPTRKDVGPGRRAMLLYGQNPFAVVLSCSDSRVPTELIFDQGLGDLFVVRVAGNVTDTTVVGTIEFGVEQLGASLVVVLGHESCGAVKAALEGKSMPGQLGTLLSRVHIGSLTGKGPEALPAAIRANTLYQAEQLSRIPIVRKMLESGRLRIVCGIYSLETGKVTWLEQSPSDPSR